MRPQNHDAKQSQPQQKHYIGDKPAITRFRYIHMNTDTSAIRTGIDISVILPVYNSEPYLGKCIGSILDQSLKSIEIIAVNDCSTDSSLDILKAFSESSTSIKIIDHPVNLGAGAARNNAIKRAKGKYIAFIDSDDWFGSNYLERLYEEAEKTHADIVFSNMLMVNGNKEKKHGLFQRLAQKYKDSNVSLIDLPDDCRPTAPWMKLFRRDFITSNDLKFLEGIQLGAEDVPFSWIAYFIANKISFCEDAYYYYNFVPESLDRRVNQNIIQIFDALRFTSKECQRFDPTHSRQAQLDTLFVSHAHYQFSKVTRESLPENLQLASVFWGEAHKDLINIVPRNILYSNSLRKNEKDYYFDVIKHPQFDVKMRKKYFSDATNSND